MSGASCSTLDTTLPHNVLLAFHSVKVSSAVCRCPPVDRFLEVADALAAKLEPEAAVLAQLVWKFMLPGSQKRGPDAQCASGSSSPATCVPRSRCTTVTAGVYTAGLLNCLLQAGAAGVLWWSTAIVHCFRLSATMV